MERGEIVERFVYKLYVPTGLQTGRVQYGAEPGSLLFAVRPFTIYHLLFTRPGGLPKCFG